MGGYKKWNTNDVLTASNLNEYLGSQVVTVFLDTTARDTAINGANLSDGMVCYINSGDSSEGLYTYNGTTWRKGPGWNAPWGAVLISATPAAFDFNNSLDFSNQFTFSSVNNRRYRVSLTGDVQNSTVTGADIEVGLYVNVASVLLKNGPKVVFGAANTRMQVGCSFYWTSTSTGTQTWKIGAESSTSTTVQTYTPSEILIEDVGPAGAPV